MTPACDLCGWSGNAWALLERRPNVFTAVACPSCGSYPRDRILWRLVKTFSAAFSSPAVLEVGGRRRLGGRLRGICRYTNADVSETDAGIDVHIMESKLTTHDHSVDLVLLSFVLCEVPDSDERVALLRELFRVTKDHGAIFVLDDFDFSTPKPLALNDNEYFHAIRLGSDIWDELILAGWTSIFVAHPRESGAELRSDFPAVVAFRGDHLRAIGAFRAEFHLRTWADSRS